MAQYNLIEHHVEQAVISQRATDGYVNATAMCQAAGKQMKHYLENKSTTAFLNELQSVVGIPTTDLVQIIQGGDPQLQGTWVHPDVAVHLAQWCSPKFAVQVSRFVREWLQGTHSSQLQLQSWRHFHDRVDMTKCSVPIGYFGIFHEIATMIVPMISAGVKLDDHTIPDISVGKTWANHWRDNNFDTTFGQRINYPHNYPDYYRQAAAGEQDAWCYPESALAEFRRWFREEYQKGKLAGYINNKRKKGDIEPETANIMIDTLIPKSPKRLS